MLNFKLVLSNVVLPFSKKKLPETKQNFKKILKNVMMPNRHVPKTRKVVVPVKPDPSLLNKVSKPWKPSLKRLNLLQLLQIISLKMPKENVKSLRVTWKELLKELKNLKAKQEIEPLQARLPWLRDLVQQRRIWLHRHDDLPRFWHMTIRHHYIFQYFLEVLFCFWKLLLREGQDDV